MALFNFGKKKEEKKNCCTCCSSQKEVKSTNECCGTKAGNICCIKVLGAGCATCHKQYENVKEAVKALGLDVEVEYITDLAKVMEYGVMSMPAIAVNEKVVSMGKLLKASDIQILLQKI